jgi:hypothetical protein
VCERTASLLDPESFPDRRKEFPVRPLKFPVPLRREFAEKALAEPALFGVRSSRSEPKTAKFPVFSLMIREFDAENGSQQTATSATASMQTLGFLTSGGWPVPIRVFIRANSSDPLSILQ